jgi:pilus assembly protein CpaC
MAIRTSIRAAALVALIVGAGLAPMGAAQAADPPRVPVIKVAASEATSHFLSLGIGKAVVVDLPRDIKDVLVADPTTANAVIRTSRRAYLIGMKAGRTNILFFDAEGQQIGGYDIAVTREVSNIRALLKRMLPDADITIEELGQSLVLSGTVATPVESQLAYDIAVRLVGTAPGITNTSNTISTSNTVAGANGTSSTVGQTTGSAGDSNVVNALTIRGRDQVMLKVTVAEVSRNVIKQFGIDLSGSFAYGSSAINFNTTNAFPLNGSPASNFTGAFHNNSVTANVRAMEQTGVIRILAEPNLTAISGETAQFLAGGKFPYPTPPQQAGGAPGFEFQNFGVNLMFTPVVLSEGRISLKVKTEVSELSPETSVTVSGTTVPGLKVRSANTTVEIPSGGSLAMAGMIQQETKHTISGIPGVAQLPILGTLFRSRDYLNNQTELMILVTPYIVRAVAQKQLSRPDDGFADPADPSSVLLGKLNRVYGLPASPPKDAYHGNIGFILD